MRITDVFHTPEGKTILACTGATLGFQCSLIRVNGQEFAVKKVETQKACFTPGAINCFMEVEAETVPIGEFAVLE